MGTPSAVGEAEPMWARSPPTGGGRGGRRSPGLSIVCRFRGTMPTVSDVGEGSEAGTDVWPSPACDDRPDPPHLFVVHADLVRLACTDVLVPTNSDRTVSASLQALVPDSAIKEGSGNDGAPSRTLRVSAPPGRVVELGRLPDERRA